MLGNWCPSEVRNVCHLQNTTARERVQPGGTVVTVFLPERISAAVNGACDFLIWVDVIRCRDRQDRITTGDLDLLGDIDQFQIDLDIWVIFDLQISRSLL